jgi:citrate synthase
MATAVGGLREVEAADSAITWIDGEAGELRYRGYPIGQLAESCTFEQVVYLLWHGELPSATELDDLRGRLREARSGRQDLSRLAHSAPVTAHPLDVLRYCVSRDALDHPVVWDNSTQANERKAVEFTGWFPVAAAAYHRRRSGLDAIEPRPDLDSAAGFLWMLRGTEASETAARALDMLMILYADHEFNASTFAARVTIATQSNLHAAVASALGTLSGPRHGGASDNIIRMLESIERPDRAEEYVRNVLARRERVMGFGHAVYRIADPRSRHLRGMASRLVEGTPREAWMAILGELETIMSREKNLYPNVDLYAAVVNHVLGIDPAFYSSVFAVSRIVGWTAHAIEQLDERLIRPAARYTGPELRNVPGFAG